MALTNGPNLGVLVDGGIGEVHYDALMKQWRAMDALVQPRVKSAVISTPPVSPTDGDCYIVPSGSSGVWSTHTNKIARYSSKATAWEYYTPKDGWVVHNEATSSFIKFNGTAWVDPIINKADLVDGKVPASQLPSYVDDILEFPDLASFPVTGESGKIYVAIDTGNGYRWSGSTYVKISQPLEEIPQAIIEAGTDSGLFALTARRVRQAISAWWNSLTNIDGKNIGATTPGTGRFTTLTTGRVGVATNAGALTRVTIDTASDTGIDLFRSTAEAQFGGIRFRDSANTTTRGQIGWASNDVRYESTGNTLIIAEGAERARVNSTGLSVTGNLTSTGVVDVVSGQIKFPATQNASADPNTLDEYREASYTATATGMTTSPTGTVEFVRVGRTVTMQTPNIGGTSNATTFTLTGGPTTMRPTAGRVATLRMQDNGGDFVWGMVIIGTDGVLSFFKDANSGSFTSSGTKTVRPGIISYII